MTEEFSTDSRIRELEEQNANLKQKLDDLRYLYDNLIDTQEKVPQDYRRFLQLKAKNIQLERQVQQLSSASEIRAELVNEMQNYALELQQTCTGDSNFPLDSNYINRWASSVITKLSQYQICSKQAENQKYFMSSDYMSNPTSDSISVQDVCNGKTQDLAYLDISKLFIMEDKLSALYSHLVKLHHTVKEALIPNLIGFENTTTKSKVLSQIQTAAKVLDEVKTDLVDMSMIMPSKYNYSVKTQKNSEVDFNAEDNYTKYELSLSTNQVLSRLPQFSRNRAECEKAIRSLVRAFHVQKNIWEIEREVLKEEAAFFKKGYDFQTSYAQSMINEIKECFKQYNCSNSNGGGGPSSDYLDQIVRQFQLFDNESTEPNLRSLLKALKTITTSYSMLHEEQEPNKASSLNMNSNYERFLRDLEIIQQEYRLKEENIIGKKYTYEEELLQNPMFMEAIPTTSPALSTSHKPTSRTQNKTSSLGLNRVSVSGKPNTSTKSKAPSIADRKSTSTLSREVSRDLKSSAPHRINQSNQKLNPSRVISELSTALTQKEEEIASMNYMLHNSNLSDMQRYALNKKIQLEKAELKKLERSMKNLEQ